MTDSSAARLLATHPRQPDRRSCGASVLVVERALRDHDYARFLVDGRRFRDEVLGMHRRTTGPVTVTGRLQLPWPRAVGTPPWAVAGKLSTRSRPHVVRWAWRRSSLLHLIDTHVAAGTTVPLYVGSRGLPRHVVLVIGADDDELACYEPHEGLVRPFTRQAFVESDLALAGWSTPWCAVVPRWESTPPPARRSQA